jgi:hypothetical protein
MFNEKMRQQNANAFSKAKDQVFKGGPILKSEEAQPKTVEQKAASTKEVQSALDKWTEIQELVSEGKSVSSEQFKELAHLAHRGGRTTQDKKERTKMDEIEITATQLSKN